MTGSAVPDGSGAGYPQPVRRPRREEVRRRLLDAAATTFLEKGYLDSTLDDIARRAGLSKGAVYSNFASKQEIFGAMLAERITRMSSIVSAAEASGGRASAVIADDIVSDAAWIQLVLEFASRAGRDPAVREIYAPFLRAQYDGVTDALVQAAVADKEHAALAAVIVIALRNGLALAHAADPDQVSGAVIENALDAVFRALVATRAT